jgi:formylglycine-generating enzyme required for sulfatase activity
MKLTGLGKFLVFLIGLGLVVTAIYKFVPPEKHPWRGFLEKRAATTPEPKPATTPTRPSPPARPAATGRWVTVPAGSFAAGADGIAIDVPAYQIQRAEVTNAEYERFVRECPEGSACGPRGLPSYWDDANYVASHGDHPVVFVSWHDAGAYCRSIGGRLPSAAEWEKAARGTDGRSFPAGPSLNPTAVNILGADRRDEKTRAEKQIPTWPVSDPRYGRDESAYGVHGMAGNVSEWTSTASEEEPDLRLAAGGSWDSWDLSDARVYHRLPKNPSDRSSSLGLRCAKGAT